MIHLREQYWAVEETNPQHAVISGNTITWVANGAQARGFKVLPAGNWQIVCTSKEVTEEQAKQIVEQQTGGGMFKDYQMRGSIAQYGTYMIQSATESLRSLLTSKGCDLNKNWLILKKQ
jgi:uncharacterized protein YydD (DUF2326 family)